MRQVAYNRGDFCVRKLLVGVVAMGLAWLLWPFEGHAQDLQTIEQSVWTLDKVTGDAWIESPGHEPMLVRRDRKLYPGQTLTTAHRTRLRLVRGEEQIQVGSSSTLSLPDIAEIEPGKTVIRQFSGTLHLQVDKKKVKHFSVETPFMVASVKGTRFTVSVDKTFAGVRVHEGVVAVQNRLANEVADLTAGQSMELNIPDQLQGRETDIASIGVVRWTVMDRGEVSLREDSELARQKAEEKARNQAGPVGRISYGISDYLGMVAGKVGAGLNFVILTISAAVYSMLQSVFGIVPVEKSVYYWVVVIMLGVVVGAVAGITLAIVSSRKKRL